MSSRWTTYSLDGEVDDRLFLQPATLLALLKAMRAQDILDERTPRPDWPDMLAPDYREQVQALLERGGEPLKIPIWKLTCNFGWHISARECALLAQRLAGVEETWVKHLVSFAATAVIKGGFRVQ